MKNAKLLLDKEMKYVQNKMDHGELSLDAFSQVFYSLVFISFIFILH